AVEPFFWTFCDDYIELVRERAHGTTAAGQAGSESARAALSITLEGLLRRFAPVSVFATGEVWSRWRRGSVRIKPWPRPAPLRDAPTTRRRPPPGPRSCRSRSGPRRPRCLISRRRSRI